MAHDIFISYSNKDENVVRAVSNALEAQKIRCWYASRDIPAGAEWASSIMNAIKEAKVLLLIFTDYSNESGQVRREVNNAISYGIPVIPFKLTPNNPSGGMEYYLSTVHWLDAVNQPLEESIQNLVVRVKAVLGMPDLRHIENKQPPESYSQTKPPSLHTNDRQPRPWYKTAIPILLTAVVIIGVLFATGILPHSSAPTPMASSVPSPTPVATAAPSPSFTPPPAPTSSPAPSTTIQASLATAKELMADICLETEVKNAAVYSVFSNETLKREQILSITFLDTLKDMPENAWDVSKKGSYGQVKAWAQKDEQTGLYNLYIAAAGGVAAPSDCSGLFNGYTNLKTIDFGNTFFTDNTTNMRLMFFNCNLLSELNLSGFNTHLVTRMGSMFYACNSLEELDLSGFDTSSVTNMSTMFYECKSLEKLLLVGFNTSSVTSMGNMFAGCSMLKELDLSSFDTSSVTKMSNMFYGCNSISNLDLSNFDTSLVNTMFGMFMDCSSLKKLNIDNFDTSKVTTMKAMFMDCNSLEELDILGFNTSSVTDMKGMFTNCSSLKALNVSSFDTSSVTDMFAMFANCSLLQELDVSSFNTSKVTTMKGMFQDCSSLTSLDVSGFSTENVIDMSQMFSGCDALESLDVSNFDTSKVEEYDSFMPDNLNPDWRDMFQKHNK